VAQAFDLAATSNTVKPILRALCERWESAMSKPVDRSGDAIPKTKYPYTYTRHTSQRDYLLKYINAASATKAIAAIQRIEPLNSVFLAIN